MTAQPIEWHENCLKNMKQSLENELYRISMLQKHSADLNHACLLLEAQICLAKDEGKTEFDSDRYARKRKSK